MKSYHLLMLQYGKHIKVSRGSLLHIQDEGDFLHGKVPVDGVISRLHTSAAAEAATALTDAAAAGVA